MVLVGQGHYMAFKIKAEANSRAMQPRREIFGLNCLWFLLCICRLPRALYGLKSPLSLSSPTHRSIGGPMPALLVPCKITCGHLLLFVTLVSGSAGKSCIAEETQAEEGLMVWYVILGQRD